MSKEKQWKYDYGAGVINGKLCKECSNDKTCKDKKCPVHKFRQGE